MMTETCGTAEAVAGGFDIRLVTFFESALSRCKFLSLPPAQDYAQAGIGRHTTLRCNKVWAEICRLRNIRSSFSADAATLWLDCTEVLMSNTSMPMICSKWLTALLSASLCCGPASGAETGDSFLDGFDRLNPDRWILSDGWVNGDWMNCVWSKDAASVRNGYLILSLEPSSEDLRPYRCGEIQSRAVYGYGTYEIRFRTGRGSGLNAAFFTYIGPVHGEKHHEIDVEVLLRDPGRVSFNTYVNASPLNGRSVKLPNAADAEFLHFAFTWRPGSVTWFVNGEERHRTEPGMPLPTTSQKIYASLWSSSSFTDWMGSFDSTAVPQDMQIDWIAFTRLGEQCQFPESILCSGP